jgi:hypothetical protein
VRIATVPRTVRVFPRNPKLQPTDVQLVDDERGWSYGHIVESYSPLVSWNLLQAWAQKNGRLVAAAPGCAVIDVHEYEDGPIAARRVG